MKSEATTKASPLFGMLLFENVESYFGSTFLLIKKMLLTIKIWGLNCFYS
jgi:hypothetical protein